nr:hypoxanthine phosphoribosyltransferase [Adlercreutzia muris]
MRSRIIRGKHPGYGKKVVHVHNDISKILFSEQDLANRVREMGENITADYAAMAGPEGIVVISILRGGAIFTCDLVRAIDMPLEMDFMAVSSYGNGVKSSGVVRILKDLNTDIRGRHVIIAEDIIDSGLTLKYLMQNLQSRGPASMTVAALMKKNTENQADIECRYVGFECPDEFIVGYGLDYAERYRNLPYIGVLKPEIYQ